MAHALYRLGRLAHRRWPAFLIGWLVVLVAIGGAAATNAGGAEVLRYGTARARIAGLRAVLPDGAVLDRRRPPPKDNTGYDLVGQLVGSEGTLAVITDVTWRLDPAPRARTVVALAFPSVPDAVGAVPALRGLPGLLALEWSDGAAVARVAAHLDAPAPLPTDGCWVFAELDAPLSDAAALAELLPDDRIAVAEAEGRMVGHMNEDHADAVRRARLAWAAAAVGTSQAVLDHVSEYVKERKAFGEPIGYRQAVAFMVADIATELDGRGAAELADAMGESSSSQTSSMPVVNDARMTS